MEAFARGIASKLQCSTRPIFTCYENMIELKKDFLHFAFDYHNQYVAEYGKLKNINPCLFLPLSYIEIDSVNVAIFATFYL